jgi:hypothetical protein
VERVCWVMIVLLLFERKSKSKRVAGEEDKLDEAMKGKEEGKGGESNSRTFSSSDTLIPF